ncbi:hypothetical protein HOA91_00050 [Candidatus Woesearchaeota archaeon]|jgi:hypothetical protein|nr:hypothetical protein [Candidatus Woesearchaeota archaeon]
MKGMYDPLELIVIKPEEVEMILIKEMLEGLGKLYCPTVESKEPEVGYKVLEAGERVGSVYKI